MVAIAKTSTRKSTGHTKRARKSPARQAKTVKKRITKAVTNQPKTTKTGASSKIKAMTSKQTSLQIITKISDITGIDKKNVKAVFAEMQNIIESHIMRRGSGECPVPELGIKIRRHERPARKARMGRNPATGEPVKIAAKPKQHVVKVIALAKLKAILNENK